MSATILEKTRAELAARVEKIVLSTPVYDIHTHLYDPAFGELLLWGIDDLLVYHYLVSEAFRYLDMPYDRFWAQSKTEQADLIWDALFVKHSPISEACRGVLTTLMADTRWESRAYAVLGLAQRADSVAVARSVAEQDPSPTVRAWARYALGDVSVPTAAQPIALERR